MSGHLAGSKARDRTLRHVAELAGVSRQAAGAILGERAHLFRAETRDRVRAAAKEIGYRPNAAARAILTRQTKQIGVLIRNDADHPQTYPHAYYQILGINLALEAAGYVLCLVRIGDVEAGLSGESRVFREHVLDGIIVTTAITPRLCDAVESLVPNCIWADTNVWRATRCVRRDEKQAGIMAARAAVAAGYKKVFFVGNVDVPEKQHYSHTLRGEGVKRVCRDSGVECEVFETEWSWVPELADRFAPHVRPDVAIIASDVARARLVASAAQRVRLVPGVDFSLVCCDGAPEVDYGWPDLARVDFDRFALGRAAAEMMLSLLRAGPGREDGATLQSVLLPAVGRTGRRSIGASRAGVGEGGWCGRVIASELLGLVPRSGGDAVRYRRSHGDFTSILTLVVRLRVARDRRCGRGCASEPFDE